MSRFKKLLVLGCISSALTFGISLPVFASDAGAFLGGVAVARIGQNMRARTQAEQQQAYYAQQQAQQPQQAAPAASQSPEARIKQLDKLAAGGYITPAEYKQKKAAIVNSM